MRRLFVALGFALVVGACHGGGNSSMPPSDPMNPMGYRAVPQVGQAHCSPATGTNAHCRDAR